MSIKNIYEVLDDFEKAPDKQSKIDVLRRNVSYALKEVLRGTYNPNIRFMFEKAPVYKPSDSPIGMGYSSVTQELSRVYLFEENNPKAAPNLTMKRREQLLIQILESLEKREAEVFMNMILKKPLVSGLDENLVKEAFPGLI